MILRGAVISDKPRTISTGGNAPMLRALVTSHEEPVANRHLMASVAGERDEPRQSPLSEIHAIVERPLSFESVAAWLAVQDAETRAACASLLADELTQVHELAKSEGYATGETQGHRDALAALDKERVTLSALSTAAERAFAEEQSRLAELCIDIVAESFTRLAGPLLCSKQAASLVVAQVLARVKEERDLRIRVNPADLPGLQADETLVTQALSGRKASFVADARVEIGGCIVESKLGGLDGRLDVQLRQLYETLRAAKTAPVEGA